MSTKSCINSFFNRFYSILLCLPNRINKALIQRKEEKYQRESEAKIAQAAENEKKAQEKIIEAIRNEEAV